jgi:uncharacterized protein
MRSRSAAALGRAVARLPGALVVAATVACGAPGELPPLVPVAFDSAPLAIVAGGDTIRLRVELARSPRQQEVGLMERDTLAEDAGMLFLYERPKRASDAFHMYRTLIPLEIAFIDPSGVIRRVQRMEPCFARIARNCFAYEAGVEFIAALEVNPGFFVTRGIGVGDRVLLDDLRR